jgi:integrase
MGNVFTRATKKGKTWYCQYHDCDGRRVQEAVRWARSKSEARQALAKKEEEVRQAKASGFWGVTSNASFAELAESFMEEHSKLRKRSWDKDERTLRVHLLPVFGNVKARDLSPAMIEAYRKRRKAAGAAEASINRETACMKSILERACRRGELEHNPAKALTMYHEEPRDRVFSDDELQAILDKSPVWLQWLIITAVSLGFRVSELCSLTWDRVRLDDGGWITIDAPNSKNKTARTVPMTPTVLALFKSLWPGLGEAGAERHVFLLDGKPIKRDRVSRYFKAACIAAKIKDADSPACCFHALRHTFAQRAWRAGLHKFVVMEIGGWKSDTMLRRYDKIDGFDLKAAAALLEAPSPPSSDGVFDGVSVATADGAC